MVRPVIPSVLRMATVWLSLGTEAIYSQECGQANAGGDRHRPFAAGARSTSFATRITVFLMRFSPAQ